MSLEHGLVVDVSQQCLQPFAHAEILPWMLSVSTTHPIQVDGGDVLAWGFKSLRSLAKPHMRPSKDMQLTAPLEVKETS